MKTKEDKNQGQYFINRIWSLCFCTCAPDNECALIPPLRWGEENSVLLAHCIASSVSSGCMSLNNRKVYSLSMKCHWIFNSKHSNVCPRMDLVNSQLKERPQCVQDYQFSICRCTWIIMHLHHCLFRLWCQYSW